MSYFRWNILVELQNFRPIQENPISCYKCFIISLYILPISTYHAQFLFFQYKISKAYKKKKFDIEYYSWSTKWNIKNMREDFYSIKFFAL